MRNIIIFTILILVISSCTSELQNQITVNNGILNLKDYNEVITPLMPQYFSVNGIENFTHSLQELNKSGSSQAEFQKAFQNLNYVL